MNQNPLGTEKIPKLVARYAIPSIIGMLVSAMYNIVDQIFIGQGVGMLGNAATNVAFPIVTVTTALGLLLGIGGASNFNLSMGADEKDKAKKFIGNTVSLLVVFGVLLMIMVKVFLNPILMLCGATTKTMSYASTYTSITAIGLPAMMISMGCGHLIRSDGKPNASMFCMLIGAIVNTILDPIFIFKFGWGMAGAAYATIIGQFVSAIVALWYIFHYKTVKLDKSCFRIRKKYSLDTFKLGMAASINQVAMMLVQITMNNVLRKYGAESSYGSDIPLACVGVITKVNMIFMSFAIGISQGCQPIFGFNYGAKNYKRVRETYKVAMISVTAIFTVAFLLFQFCPRQITGIFGSGTEEYFQFSARYFRIFLFLTIVNGIQPVTSNFFTSIGKPMKGVFLSLSRQVVLLLPLIVVFPMIWGIDGVMYAGPIADALAAVISVLLITKEMKNISELERLDVSGSDKVKKVCSV